MNSRGMLTFPFKMKKTRTFIFAIALFFSAVTVVIASRAYENGTGELSGTVLDTTTGLRWTKCSMMSNGVMDGSSDCSGSAAEYTWEEAVSACENLEYKGIRDWRLPNIRELQSIVTYYKEIDPFFDSLNVSLINTDYFPNIPRGTESGFYQSHFWSSTPYLNDSKRAWTFDFLWGSSPARWKTQTAFVRCVTGPVK